MNIKKLFLAIFLLTFSTLHPEIPTNQINGLASILEKKEQHLSPLCGAMVWDSGYVKNLYEYGDDNDPLVKLTRKLFYLQPDQVTFGPTTLLTNLATYFDEELIGKIINALEKDGNVKEILTDFLKKEDKKRIDEKIESYKEKLKEEKGKLEQRKKNILKKLKEQLKNFKNNLPEIQVEKIKNRIINFFNRLKDEISEKNTETFSKLIKDIKTEKFEAFKTNKQEFDQIKNDIKSIEQKIKKISDFDFDTEIKSLAELINNAKNSTQDSIFTVYDILLAMLWRKANSKQDYQKYFNQLDKSFFIDKEIIYKNDWLDNSGEYECKKIVTENPTELPLEDFIIYQKRSPSTSFPPRIRGANVTYKANGKEYNFPDCGETSLRNFFNVLLYNPETQSFNIEILRNLSLENDSDLVKFYTKYPGVSNIESHNEKDPNNNAYDDWAAIVSEINEVIYRNENVCNISGQGGIQNMYVILGNLLEIEDFDFDKLAEKLKSINIELDYNAKTDIETNNNDNAIDFELGGWLNPLNFSWRFSPGHFVITFQEKNKSKNISKFIEVLKNPNITNDKEPPHKKSRLLLDTTSKLKQKYVIYGNCLTQICKSNPEWNLKNINVDIKLMPLLFNSVLEIVMPNIVTYYYEMPTLMDVDEPEKEENLQNQLKNLITKYLRKINFLDETNFKIIDEVIKQKVSDQFSNELKKIVNQTTDPVRLGWVAKSLIINNYDSIPKWANSLTQKVITLNLHRKQLTTLPDCISNLKNLQTLNLYNNQLETLPDSFGNLKNLQALWLYNNQLTTLPDSFGNLKNLQSLDLNMNKLTTLPDSFGNLKNLQSLDLNMNKLTTLPDSFGNLKNLQALWLNNNQLTTLPDSFGNLDKLQNLYLSNNQLTTLPDSFGNLDKLQNLYLSDNQLETLPDSFGKLKNLQTLWLFHNQLTEEEKVKIRKLLPKHCIRF